MITPSVSNMLQCIATTFGELVKPELKSPAARSAAATIEHMLRVVALRNEVEGQILLDESLRLKEFLPRMKTYLAGQEASDARTVAANMERTLGTSPRDPRIYASLDLMAQDVKALRQSVADAMTFLVSKPKESLDAQGAALLNELNEYVSWQLQQEARMIEPAVVGFGPRR